MDKKFFITTPIYYANDIPHIWHAYASFICDTYARYKRLFGYEVKFSTGTDENSQKILLKAQEKNIPVMDFLDEMASQHKKVRDELEISYTDFIRTTDTKHKAFVQKVLQKVYDKNLALPENERDFYQWEYKGLYCVWCESFKKPEDLTPDWLCPDHLKKPEEIVEKNRFFRLSKYQKKLEDFYEKNADFVIPDHRFNEVKAFVKGWLEDFSISRETNKFWIPLPFAPDQVTYVWYDALLNYLTVCQNPGQEWFRPANYHLLAKDIVRFHAIYRPAMLMSADYELPNHCLVTGYFTIDGQKMSKSLWNVIKPIDIINQYSRDTLILYFLYDLIIGNDWDFSRTRLHDMHNSMLIGGRGNLISRVTKLSEKNWISSVSLSEKHSTMRPKIWESYKNNKLLELIMTDFSPEIFEKTYLENNNLQTLIKDRYNAVQFCNQFMQDEEPRTKIKNWNEMEWKADLQFLLFMIKNLAILSAPFLTKGFEKIQSILWIAQLQTISTLKTFSSDSLKELINLNTFILNLSPENMYERVELEVKPE